MSRSPRVSIRDLHHGYDQGGSVVRVLAGVEADFAPGEMTVLLGRSGSGKTTLLNLIAALEVPQRGEIWIDGAALGGLDERARAGLRRRSLGIVFQGYNLVPTLTAAENVALPLTLNGVGLRPAREQAQRALAQVGLAECGPRFPDALSGGEQQRVAIARAVIGRPAVVLADEPTGNLDLATARAVVALLQELTRRHGSTLIMATHSQEVAGHADRVLSVEAGRLRECA